MPSKLRCHCTDVTSSSIRRAVQVTSSPGRATFVLTEILAIYMPVYIRLLSCAARGSAHCSVYEPT